MKIHKGYKYRIYPNRIQQQQLAQIFGCCRFVYNEALAFRKQVYAAEKHSVSAAALMRRVTQMRKKPDTSWLSGCDSMALQEAIKDLDAAFRGFFEKRTGFPKFHKKSSEQSYRTRNQNDGIRIADKRHIRLPKLGILKAKVSRFPNGRILHATVRQTASRKYFVSLCVEEELQPKPNAGCLTGIDVGLKAFYTDSNGKTVANPHTLRTYEVKLRRAQRSLSRMMEANIVKRDAKGRPVWKKPLSECRNLQKQRIKVARLHEKTANVRQDFLQKQSTALVRENAFLAVEDLNIKGMIRNRHLSKAISDVSWSAFFRMLDDKAFEHGCELVRIPTFYPSSQTCSVCGYQNPTVKDLSVRYWECPVCGSVHNRDVNAAVNILNKGLAMQQEVS